MDEENIEIKPKKSVTIQPEMIVEVRKVFDIFDEDRDGKITTKELGSKYGTRLWNFLSTKLSSLTL